MQGSALPPKETLIFHPALTAWRQPTLNTCDKDKLARVCQGTSHTVCAVGPICPERHGAAKDACRWRGDDVGDDDDARSLRLGKLYQVDDLAVAAVVHLSRATL